MGVWKRGQQMGYGDGSVTQRKDGKWVARIEAGWTSKGTRRRPSRVRDTEAAAKRALRDLKRELLTGQEVTGRKVSVKAWCEDWLKVQSRRVRPKTLQTDTSIVRKWIVPTIGHRRLGDLTPADVRKTTEAVRTAGRSSTTANYTQRVLERALRAAIREGHHVPERVLMVDKPAPEVSDRTALAVPQAAKMLESVSALPDGSRWIAALLQGMRQGECLGLTWDHVDFKARAIDVSWQLQSLKYADRERETFLVPDGYEARRLEGAWHLTRPKTRQGRRVIPMLDWMHDPLLVWRGEAPESRHGLVWPRASGMPQSAKVDRERWRALQEVAGVAHPNGRPYTLHEARNTTASLLLAAGVDPTIIQAILGHSSYVVSQGYMTVDDAMVRDALNRGAQKVIEAARKAPTVP
ncbi:MAG TPA: site-specific integrase [Beutenbergiaceae bacterium]|nr:site-specific integrase [Beutenbergiaceae bacterium]